MTSHAKKQKKSLTTQNPEQNMQDCGQMQKECRTYNWNIRRRRREWSRYNNGQEHFNINGKQESTNPGTSENIKQDKYQIKHTSADYIQIAETQRENIVVMVPQLY